MSSLYDVMLHIIVHLPMQIFKSTPIFVTTEMRAILMTTKKAILIYDLYTAKETHQKQRKFYQSDIVMQTSMQRSHISFQLLRFLILQ